jgi:hypothetical protein
MQIAKLTEEAVKAEIKYRVYFISDGAAYSNKADSGTFYTGAVIAVTKLGIELFVAYEDELGPRVMRTLVRSQAILEVSVSNNVKLTLANNRRITIGFSERIQHENFRRALHQLLLER